MGLNEVVSTSFGGLKAPLVSSLLLTYYDLKTSLIVAADASTNRVGTAILHEFPNTEEKVEMYASRTRTPEGKSYRQIVIICGTSFSQDILQKAHIID